MEGMEMCEQGKHTWAGRFSKFTEGQTTKMAISWYCKVCDVVLTTENEQQLLEV